MEKYFGSLLIEKRNEKMKKLFVSWEFNELISIISSMIFAI